MIIRVMLPRFHAPAIGVAGDDVALPPDEARHLVRVMRLGVGDEVAVFDGRGREYRAQVVEARKDVARVRLLEPLTPAVEPGVHLTLAQAILKHEAMDDVVRDATMMGVSTIVPIVSAHVVVRPRAADEARVVERWQRVALASAKQCRRATLPEIVDPLNFQQWLTGSTRGLRLMLIEPAAAHVPTRTLHEWLPQAVPAAVEVVVGPEGGWSRAEVESAMQVDCVPINLGALTLRAQSVPLVALALCQFVFCRGTP